MAIDSNDLHALSNSEKLLIVEMLWDDLEKSPAPIPLPEWAVKEVEQRRRDMRDPAFGLSHEETWRRIANRNG